MFCALAEHSRDTAKRSDLVVLITSVILTDYIHFWGLCHGTLRYLGGQERDSTWDSKLYFFLSCVARGVVVLVGHGDWKAPVLIQRAR